MDPNEKRISKGGASSKSSRNSIAASHEFCITSRASSVASGAGAPTESTPGCLTLSFLNSLERSPDEPLRLESVFSQYHLRDGAAIMTPLTVLQGAGTCRSGMGSAAKSRWAGLAIRRAHWVDRDTRALSVDRPVLANICR